MRRPLSPARWEWTDTIQRRVTDARVPASVMRVCAVIARYDGPGRAWPSIARIATESRYSQATVRRAIRTLERLGEVVVITADRRDPETRNTNVYRLAGAHQIAPTAEQRHDRQLYTDWGRIGGRKSAAIRAGQAEREAIAEVQGSPLQNCGAEEDVCIPDVEQHVNGQPSRASATGRVALITSPRSPRTPATAAAKRGRARGLGAAAPQADERVARPSSVTHAPEARVGSTRDDVSSQPSPSPRSNHRSLRSSEQSGGLGAAAPGRAGARAHAEQPDMHRARESEQWSRAAADLSHPMRHWGHDPGQAQDVEQAPGEAAQDVEPTLQEPGHSQARGGRTRSEDDRLRDVRGTARRAVHAGSGCVDRGAGTHGAPAVGMGAIAPGLNTRGRVTVRWLSERAG